MARRRFARWRAAVSRDGARRVCVVARGGIAASRGWFARMARGECEAVR
jgi:hypothetical protein